MKQARTPRRSFRGARPLLVALLAGYAIGSRAQESSVAVVDTIPLPQGLRVVLSLPQPAQAIVVAPNGSAYTKLTLRGTGAENEFGQPALPLVHHAEKLPPGVKVVVNIEERNLTEFPVAKPVWPHQPPVPKLPGARAAQDFAVEVAAYSAAKSATYQKAKNGAVQVKQYRKRGQDYVDIIARPFAYHVQKSVVRYPRELVLELTYLAPDLPKAAGPRPGRITVLRMKLRGKEDLEWLAREGFNFERRAANEVEVYATEPEVQTLREAGFEVKETGAQPGASKRTGAGAKGLGSYHDYAALTARLQGYGAGHPDLCRLASLGQSVQGRELWAMKITTNPDVEGTKPRVRLASTLHGDEPLGTELCLRFMDLLLNGSPTNARLANLLAATEIWVLPLLNPDGLEAGTRFNADGFDLNRSFPEGGGGGLGNPLFGPGPSLAGRPPEVVHLIQFATNRNFTLAANLHGGALVVNYPYDDDDLGAVDSPTPDDALLEAVSRAYSSNNPPMWASATFPQGIVNGAAWYVIRGGMQDWHYRYVGCNEVTIEIANDKTPPADQIAQYWADNREAVLSFFETVHSGVRGRITDAGSGAAVQAAVMPFGIAHPAIGDPQSGAYQRMLLPGTYDFLFTAPGYARRMVSNVVVQAGGSTEVNVALEPLAGAPEGILLVTSEALRSGLEALAVQKEVEGFAVQGVVVPNGTDAPRVRSTLREVYAIFPADYVLVVGDTAQIPTFADGHATDLPYGLMDHAEGLSDYLGKDVVLGRVSLQTSAAIGEFVQKLRTFAEGRTNRLGDLTWVAHGYESSEYDQAERAHDWCITNCLPPTYYAARFFRDAGSAAELSAHINAGTEGVIYSGHGSETSWARYDYDLTALADLHNLDRVPLVIGHCCVSGSFDLNVCFAEGWLQTTARGVAYVGASDNTFWDEDEWMQMAEFEAMKWTQDLSLGKAIDDGLFEVHTRNPGKAQYYYTAYHVFGDPTLVMFDTEPFPLTQRTPSDLAPAFKGASYFQTFRAAGGVPPYGWSLTAGELPPGLSFDTAAGTLFGTPGQAGTYAFTLRVADASSPPQSDERTFTVVVWDLSQAFNDAVDTSGWVWTSGGTALWHLQSATTHDGVDAAQSGAIGDGQLSWLETTVNGPGALTFWWKVSSEADYDFLEFFINGELQENAISGEVSWNQQTFFLGDGPQRLRWNYVKDGSASEGSDGAWVDQIQWGTLETPLITSHPQSHAVVVGDTAWFQVDAVGAPPLAFQWFYEGAALPGATAAVHTIPNAQPAHAGGYWVVVSNTHGSVTSVVATLTVGVGVGLAEALDTLPHLVTIGGDASWTGQTLVTHDHLDAAQSGALTDDEECWMEMTVDGPGALTFWWRVSSEAGYDYLQFYLNGSLQSGRISGEHDWQPQPFVLDDGPQTLRWRYSKDGSVSSGEDRGWVDQVSFTPAQAPVIVVQPQSQTVVRGNTATLEVMAAGAAPLSYQWYFNGVASAGATGPSYAIPDVQFSHAGPYVVVVANSLGSVTSTVATLTVVEGISLAEALDVPDWVVASGGDAPWIAQTTVTHDGSHAGQSGDVEDEEASWLETTVLGPGTLSFWWQVSSEADYDFLDFYTNEVLVASISGEVNWQPETCELAPGLQTLRWEYVKDSSMDEGLDLAWLDQVAFAPVAAPPFISRQPQPRTAPVGFPALFTVTVLGETPLYFQWRKDGVNLAGAEAPIYQIPNVQLSHAGDYSVVISNALGTATSVPARLTVVPVGGPMTNTVLQPGTIALRPAGPASPYPSILTVTGLAGSIQKAVATVSNLTHAYASDLHLLLVGPAGAPVVLMADAGGGDSLDDVTLTFDDDAPLGLPEDGWMDSGSYRPTDFNQSTSLPAPAPARPYRDHLAVYAGTSPNGEWRLFAWDDADQDGGWISGGWALTFVTVTGSSTPTILHPVVSGGQIQFSFQTETGHSYLIECKEELSDTSWQPVQTLPGDGMVQTFAEPCAARNRFYRVRVE